MKCGIYISMVYMTEKKKTKRKARIYSDIPRARALCTPLRPFQTNSISQVGHRGESCFPISSIKHLHTHLVCVVWCGYTYGVGGRGRLELNGHAVFVYQVAQYYMCGWSDVDGFTVMAYKSTIRFLFLKVPHIYGCYKLLWQFRS